MELSKNTVVVKLRDRRGRHNCLVFNALTRNIDLVSEEVLEEAFSTPAPSISEQALRLQQRYYFEDQEIEERLERRVFDIYMQRRQSQSKPYFFLIPTYSCNVACAYCWQTELHGQQEVMTEEALASALEAIEQMMERFKYASVRPTIEIFGGECLQPHSIQAVYRILELVDERDWDAVVTTNGALLNRYSEALLGYRNLLGVHVTVDGPRHIHNERRPFKHAGGEGLLQIGGSQRTPEAPLGPVTRAEGDPFGNIMEGLEPLIVAGRRVVMRVNLNSDNAPHLPELLDYVGGRGWLDRSNFEVALEPVTDNSGDRHGLNSAGVRLLRELIPSLERYPQVLFTVGHCGADVFDYILNRGELPPPAFNRCGAENSTLFLLDLHGKIYTCIEAAGFPEHSVGQFLPNLEFNTSLTKWHQRNVLDTPGCRTCNVKFVCGGGCGWNAYNKYGELLHSMCPPIKGQMEALFDHYYDLVKTRVPAIGWELPRGTGSAGRAATA